jgi:SMC interacting uncharacterized protein involved in chromosome segregation
MPAGRKPNRNKNKQEKVGKKMKNDLQNLTEDISRLYEDITQKAESLGQIDSITRLYDELQAQLQGISTEEVDMLQSQIKSTLEQMVGISKSLAVIKTLKMTLNGHDELADLAKKATGGKDSRRSMDDR